VKNSIWLAQQAEYTDAVVSGQLKEDIAKCVVFIGEDLQAA
jgi:hypothetical protein